MPSKANPFRPGGIVAPGMFAGRYDEVLALERCLVQAKSGNPRHFLIRGERGIGKSSLLFFLEAVATGTIPSLESGRFRFVPVTIELDRNTEFADLVRRVARGLQRGLAPVQRAKELLKDAWGILKRVEAFGVKYSDAAPSPKAQDEVIDDLISTLSEAATRLADDIDGILLMMDEADKPRPEADLGIFLKHLTERLTKRGCNRAVVGLAGLPGIVAKLRKSHESSPRIFDIISLEPLTPDERLQVIRRGLAQAKETNDRETTITPEAESLIASISEGYPHFIQQFAHSSFEADTDDTIDQDDVLAGAFGENGALHQLGLKYFEELYFDQIGSDEYREVLRTMSDELDGWVTKEQLRSKTGLKAHTVNNAVVALKKRSIIVAKPGKTGVYRLPSRSFAVWIRAFTRARATGQTQYAGDTQRTPTPDEAHGGHGKRGPRR